jgi:hypothetical protein
MNNLAKALLIWLLLLPIRSVLAVVQKWILINFLGWVPGSIAAGLILMAIILFFAYLAWAFSSPQPARVYWLVGAMWLLLTLALDVYQVMHGRFLYWGDLVHRYTFYGGDMGLLVALTLLGAPRMAGERRTGTRKRWRRSCKRGPRD